MDVSTASDPSSPLIFTHFTPITWSEWNIQLYPTFYPTFIQLFLHFFFSTYPTFSTFFNFFSTFSPPDLFSTFFFTKNEKRIKWRDLARKSKKKMIRHLFFDLFLFYFFAEKWKVLKIMRFGEKIKKNDTTCFFFDLFLNKIPKNEKCSKSWDLARKSKKMIRHFFFDLFFKQNFWKMKNA